MPSNGFHHVLQGRGPAPVRPSIAIDAGIDGNPVKPARQRKAVVPGIAGDKDLEERVLEHFHGILRIVHVAADDPEDLPLVATDEFLVCMHVASLDPVHQMFGCIGSGLCRNPWLGHRSQLGHISR
jgi:hypothetical protein